MDSVLKAEKITKEFGGLTAVDNITFSADKGEILGIIGPNGAGKTTVINVISGILPLTGGNITLKERQISDMPPHDRSRLGISRTFQTVRPLEKFTAMENIMVGALFGRELTKNKARERAESICDFLNLDRTDAHVDNLTVLELKKLELGRAMASEPEILFLDEVMAGLNSSETNEMIELIRKIKDRGVAVCVVEHVMKVVSELTDRVIVLDRGEIIARGRYEEVSKKEEVIAAYLGEEEENAED